MASVRIEFLVEPFAEGTLGPHVQASIDAARAHDLEPEVGPFGTVVAAPSEVAGRVIEAIVDAGLANGATRVSIQVDRVTE